ncbi:MAG: ABC transporter substrate-binding protein [Candidatus Methanomethyliaceae archaeon]
MKKREVFGTVVILAMILLGFVGISVAQEKESEFIIFHYWTAGGEREAINALFDLYQKRNPGVKIVENPVAGGGGETMLAVLMSNLAAGIPPDSFQDHSGNLLKDYFDAGYIEPVDDLWAEADFDARIPLPWVRNLKFKGQAYSAPINAHRTWLWYSKRLLADVGLNPPENYEELLEACRKIKEAKPEVSPLALGTREKVWVTYLYDMVLLATGGVDFYERANTGRIDFRNDPTFRRAMERFAALIPYIYPWHATKTWDEAAALLKTGEAAMYWMGDWVLGYYLNIGMEPEVDFSAVSIPSNVWLGMTDSFPLPKGAPHPNNARDWVAMCLTKEAQEAFNLIKGSVAMVNDVPPDIYPDPYRRRSAQDLKSLRVTCGGFHAGLYTAAFGSELMDILTKFLVDGDVDAAINAIAEAAERTNLAEACSWFWE